MADFAPLAWLAFLYLPATLRVVSTELGQRLRDARERAGLTQQQVANEIGVSLRTVGNWERGETVPQNRLAKLEDLLSVQLRPNAPALRPVYGTRPQREVLELPPGLTPRQRDAVRELVQSMADPAGEPGGELVDLSRPPMPDLSRVAARRGESEGRRLREEQDEDGEEP